MTPKYRSLRAFYLSFHLLDNAILVSIILSLFTGAKTPLQFYRVLWRHCELFAVIALEVIYDVFEYYVHVWILNRVSLYFVLILYGLYCTVLSLTKMWNATIFILLSFRFLSFLLETLVDFFIDLELHYDLEDDKIHKMPVTFISKLCCRNIREELEHEQVLKNFYPKGWQYKGSIFAWTPLNTFKIDDCELLKREKSVKLHQCVFEFMVIITISITFPIAIIVWLTMFILSIIRLYCCCRCRNINLDKTILAECRRNRSW